MNRNIKKSLQIFTILFLFSSCLDEDVDTAPYKKHSNPNEQTEIQNLQAYIQQKHPHLREEPNGMYILNEKAADSTAILEGDSLLMILETRFLNGEVWRTSNINFVDFERLEIPLRLTVNNDLIPGFKYAMLKSKIGYHTKAIIPSKLAYGANTNESFISPYTTVIFDYKILAKNDQIYNYEHHQMINWAQKDSITNFSTSQSGLVYKIVKKGEKQTDRNSYKFKYAANYQNLASIYFSFDKMRTGVAEVTEDFLGSKGIVEALKLIGKGGEIIVYIPSNLLYANSHKFVPIKMNLRLLN